MIVWDFIRYAREQGIPVGPGRGSAAGSFVAYCLRITDVDPIEYDLIFERFLNPERVSLPDIDIDFCERRRGEVIEYVTREVRPRERRADHHLRDDEGARRGPRRGARHGHPVRRRRPRRQGDSAGARHDAREGARSRARRSRRCSRRTSGSRSCSTVAQRLEGMTRHASVHAAGVVIAPRPLTEFVPLYKIAEGRNRHAVGDEGGRARRPPEDGLPRAQHADADRRLPRTRSSAPRTSTSTSTRSRSTTRRPTSCSATARPTACSSSRARACASCCARPSRSASTT